MKLAARISTGALERRLARLAAELEPALLDAAADALARGTQTAESREKK